MKHGGSTINTRYYFEGGYEKDISGGITRYIQYISAPVGLVAIIEGTVGSGIHNVHYTYTDHLGSILTVTNGSKNIEAEQSFDAWGRRRDVNSWALLAPTAATSLPVWLHRGYTGHEHLDQFGLINMNGRMYDPVLGRMLSPDNYVADPLFTQDYNRYTYARNNPLVYTDPDGNNPLLFMMFKGALIGGIGYLASAITSGNEGGSFSARGFGAALITGAVSAGLSSGIGYLAGGIGGINGSLFQTAAHGVVQGGVAFAQGGSFETGFATGMFGSIAAGGGGSAANMIGSAAFVGGMTTMSGGGNFWRGAAQGGIVAGFNHAMHHLYDLYNTTKEFRQQLRQTRRFFTEMREAFNSLSYSKLEIEAMKMDFFINQVKTNGPYDLKNGAYHSSIIGAESIYNGEIWEPQDYGNYNFGVAAKAFGLPLLLSKSGGGLYQIYSGTASWKWYRTYFDDPRDASMITRGYNLKWK